LNGVTKGIDPVTHSKDVKKKIIVICMVDSIHSARWLNQFKNEDIEFTLIPSTPNRKIHATISALISNTETIATYNLSKFFRWLAIPLWGIDLLFGNRLRGFLVSRLAKKNNVNFIHAMELNHSGYIALRAAEAGLPDQCKIISTNWGSDIFWFQKYPRHRLLIGKLMAASSIYSAECSRDLELATKYGFKGIFQEVLPNAGGFSNSALTKNLQIASERKIILVKGYESFVGRASIALQAISELNNELTDYEVIVYSSNRKTIKLADVIRKQRGVNIRAISKKQLSHEQMLELFAQARIYIGVSLSDGISTSLLEAMAMGAFPIQTNTSCAEEWIENDVTGKIINPDVSEVKLALLETLSDNDLVDSAMVSNRQLIKSRLSEELIESKIITFYDR
jgi:glycosyltransferase involved in cell wall biosynthesis